ncbi:hypothetical protein ACOQFV_24490 [Nocardiopsis changdeensis]
MERLRELGLLAELPSARLALALDYQLTRPEDAPIRAALGEELGRRFAQEARILPLGCAAAVLDVVYVEARRESRNSLWAMSQAYHDVVRDRVTPGVRAMSTPAILEALEAIADESRHDSGQDNARRLVYLAELCDRHPEAEQAHEEWDQAEDQTDEECRRGPSQVVIAAVRRTMG